jgi:aspartate/methionine/tyrosine aminotransferase
MNKDLLLAKPNLPSGWLDTSVGEPYSVKENLFEYFNLYDYSLSMRDSSIFEYPNPSGYKPLVDLLENRYGAPVIITNGAKQGLAAALYTLKKMGKRKVGMRTPFWALLPPLIHMQGLHPTSYEESDCNLLVMPNNPDGFTMTPHDVNEFVSECIDNHKPLIHDAAYYSHIYLPESYPLDPIGDVQLFSMSKMLGLSGLRLGYAVCHNHIYYKFIQEYMEAMTVGVSNISQILLFDLLTQMSENGESSEAFEKMAYHSIQKSKSILKQINPEVLLVPDNIEKIPGMFAWLKIGEKANFKKSKVHVVEGTHFGVPGMVRINLALDHQTLQEVVDRLNSVV